MTVSTDSPPIGVMVTGNQPAEQVSPERFDVVVIGGDQAGLLLDELSAGQRPRWTLVDAAWTPKPGAAATTDNGTAR